MRYLVALGMLAHLISSYAAFLWFARWNPEPISRGGPSTVAMYFGCPFLLGAGFGALLSSSVARRRGSQAAVRLSLIFLAVGLSLEPWTSGADRPALSSPWALIGHLLIGFGFCGLWSPAGELTSSMLSTTQRWSGMRVWSLMLPLGGFAAMAVGDVEAGWPTLIPAAMCIALACVIPRVPAPQRDMRATSAPINDVGEPRAVGIRPDDCDATECCGGSRTWLPMPLWVGAGLVAVGTFVFWVIFADVFAQQDIVGRLLLLSGVVLGTWLFQSAVPETGYAILLLPFLLMSGVCWLGLSLFDGLRDSRIALTLTGSALGATAYGCIGLVCESYESSCRGISRGSVFLVGHMATVVMLAVLMVEQVISRRDSVYEYNLTRVLIFPIGLILLRSIPSPVISSRGRDEPLDEEDSQEAAAILENAIFPSKDDFA